MGEDGWNVLFLGCLLLADSCSSLEGTDTLSRKTTLSKFTLKGKSVLPTESNCFPFREDPFSKGDWRAKQNKQAIAN